MNDIEVEQNTQEWLDRRAGNITASEIKAVLTKPRKGEKESAVRKSYKAKLVFERILGKSLDPERGNFRDIERGNRLEATAKAEYEMHTGTVLRSVGFVKHPTLPMAGCSPDGYEGEKGMVQVKCPRWYVQIEWIAHGVVPSEHRDQMLFELACHPEREWSDFCSFVDVDGLDQQLKLFIVRQKRDEVRIAEIEAAVAQFNREIEEVIAKLPKGEGRTGLQEQLEASLQAVNESKVAV
jgi:predicted phage-related endonuclease